MTPCRELAGAQTAVPKLGRRNGGTETCVSVLCKPTMLVHYLPYSPISHISLLAKLVNQQQ
uniref:Uncharacterized protein n=1 Tax=Romanomermis culicivorax TaxID=13658 RepID=A0A915IEW1_ROMCU